MSWNDRVVWSEGQFLLPQMFQQQERYLEHVMHYRSLPLTPFFWGFSHYNIDGEALNIGKLILKEASGIFPDGTPFNAPDHTPLPPPLPGYRKSTTLKAASGCIPSRVSSPPSASRCWRLLNRSSSIQNSMPRN